jgi:hypothetical protein
VLALHSRFTSIIEPYHPSRGEILMKKFNKKYKTFALILKRKLLCILVLCRFSFLMEIFLSLSRTWLSRLFILFLIFLFIYISSMEEILYYRMALYFFIRHIGRSYEHSLPRGNVVGRRKERGDKNKKLKFVRWAHICKALTYVICDGHAEGEKNGEEIKINKLFTIDFI